MAKKTTKRMTRDELAAALASAMNLLNDVDKGEWDARQLGTFHQLAHKMPERCDYANNGTVMASDL